MKDHLMDIASETTFSKTNNNVGNPADKLFDVVGCKRILTPTFADYLKHTELVVGRPYAEHTALLLSSASQISRSQVGEPGSNLHLDMITGMDERIGFSFLKN